MKTYTIHFIGILANIDSSVLYLNEILKNNFKVRCISHERCTEFFKALLGSSPFDTGQKLFLNACNVNLKHFYIHNSLDVDIADNLNPLNTLQVNSENHYQNYYNNYLSPLMRSFRLFKEGNIQIPYTHYFYFHENVPIPLSYRTNTHPVLPEVFTLEKCQFSELKEFLQDVKLPFKEKYLELAFENFELSYEVHNVNLRFLSLMNALEVLFHPSGSGELRYRISRNIAVLLGKDKKDSEIIHNEIKGFYDKRSAIVHRGKARIDIDEVLKLRYYVRESIKMIYKINKDKSELLKLLNSSGFGERIGG